MRPIGVVKVDAMKTKMGLRERVLVLETSGAMTISAVKKSLKQGAAYSKAEKWAVVCYDTRRALTAFTIGEAASIFTENPLALIGRPGAFLVSAEEAPLYSAIAWRLAQLGVERRVFSDPEPAFAWAARRALQVASQGARAQARMYLARAEEATVQLEHIWS